MKSSDTIIRSIVYKKIFLIFIKLFIIESDAQCVVSFLIAHNIYVRGA